MLIVLVLTAGWILDSSVNLAYSQTIGGVDLSKIPGLQNLTGFSNVPNNGQGTGEGQGEQIMATVDITGEQKRNRVQGERHRKDGQEKEQ